MKDHENLSGKFTLESHWTGGGLSRDICAFDCRNTTLGINRGKRKTGNICRLRAARNILQAACLGHVNHRSVHLLDTAPFSKIWYFYTLWLSHPTVYY